LALDLAEIERQPLSPNDKEVIQETLAVLKAQPIVPSEEPKEAIEAINFLAAAGKELGAFANQHLATDKSGGPVAGQALMTLTAWFWVVTGIVSAANAADEWVSSLTEPR